MKQRKHLFPLALMLGFLLSTGLNSLKAQQRDRNNLLIAQFLQDLDKSGPLVPQYLLLESWKDQKVRKLRIMNGEDRVGTYRRINEFNREGYLLRVENKEANTTYKFTYNSDGNLARLETFKNTRPDRKYYIYYTPAGELLKSIASLPSEKKEIEIVYDKRNYPLRKKEFVNSRSNGQWRYVNLFDPMGNITQHREGNSITKYLYDAQGNLVQATFETEEGTKQMAFAYDEKGQLTSEKHYIQDGEDYKLTANVSHDYNSVDLVARSVIKFRDPNSLPEKTEYYYDDFWQKNFSARRGDEASLGYGTPVVIKWMNPEEDTRTNDSLVVLQLSLKPGVGQDMPDITGMTLRHNGNLSEKNIGDVVLRKVGAGANFYVEEKVDLENGRNALDLEVRTDYGKFNSGERFISFKNPKALIYSRNLHVLCIGVSDYENDTLDTRFAAEDAQAMAQTLQSSEGTIFKKVEVTTLLNDEATLDNIKTALTNLRGNTDSKDMALIYFAGRGQSMDQQFFLKPYDLGLVSKKEELEANAVDMDWMLQEISRFRCPVSMFMDASQPLNAEGVESTADLEYVHKSIDRTFTEEEMRYFSLSSRGDQISRVNNETQRSYYAETILEALSGKADLSGDQNGVVTLDEVHTYVNDKVLDKTGFKQSPTSKELGIGLLPIAKVNKSE